MTTRMSLVALLVLTSGGLGGHPTGFAREPEPAGEAIGDLPRIPASDITLLRDANGNPVSIHVSNVQSPNDPQQINAFLQEIKRKFAGKMNKYRPCAGK
jgi:hypothetical protein